MGAQESSQQHDARAYRAGIIGTARVGSFYDDLLAATPELIPSSHAGCYAAHPETQLVAGCDLNSDHLHAFGEKWGITALYSDYRQGGRRVRFPLEDRELSVDTW